MRRLRRRWCGHCGLEADWYDRAIMLSWLGCATQRHSHEVCWCTGRSGSGSYSTLEAWIFATEGRSEGFHVKAGAELSRGHVRPGRDIAFTCFSLVP